MEQTVGRPDATNNVAVKATYFIFHDNAATEEFVEVGGNKHENDHNDSSALSISPGGISRSTRTATTSSRIFNASNTAEGIVGLQKGTKPVAPQPGDYSYSGMHDQVFYPPSRSLLIKSFISEPTTSTSSVNRHPQKQAYD
ncbi:hypothetical protein IV203_036561 [Nitzschia inconspicua]|uniref:Uncharacterized protein n=1 Tax=Nitzschia inconspicua TaxID=303405 RepID=A0A9K3LFG6_9STRA|nr:hypothetical protein IV203_036561 [Nitzschia inconspicua]